MIQLSDFSLGWLIQLLIIYFSYSVIFFLRKSRMRANEYKKQVMVALALVALAFVGEFIGVHLNLWTYIPHNWPFTVWIGYFGIGLLAYQLVKFIDEKVT